MNNTNTYHKGEYSSALDGIFTNKPNKIKFVKTYGELKYDHNTVVIGRNIKIDKCEEKIIKNWNLKKCEDIDMNEKILNHND